LCSFCDSEQVYAWGGGAGLSLTGHGNYSPIVAPLWCRWASPRDLGDSQAAWVGRARRWRCRQVNLLGSGMPVFWDVTQYSAVGVVTVSVEPIASIFK
jgi:hypothetical protein